MSEGHYFYANPVYDASHYMALILQKFHLDYISHHHYQTKLIAIYRWDKIFHSVDVFVSDWCLIGYWNQHTSAFNTTESNVKYSIQPSEAANVKRGLLLFLLLLLLLQWNLKT